MAAWNNNPEAVDILLALGADADAKDDQGATPLHRAVHAENITIVVKLLQLRASPRSLDCAYQTPFMKACMVGEIDLMAMLSPFEDDKIFANIAGQIALHLAACQSELKAFIYLINAGWDPFQLDSSKGSPIYYALS